MITYILTNIYGKDVYDEVIENRNREQQLYESKHMSEKEKLADYIANCIYDDVIDSGNYYDKKSVYRDIPHIAKDLMTWDYDDLLKLKDDFESDKGYGLLDWLYNKVYAKYSLKRYTSIFHNDYECIDIETDDYIIHRYTRIK